ncbi:MAG: bifunctional diguanylate cyclase/phosphodiesterase [Pseudomonadota bacterium]
MAEIALDGALRCHPNHLSLPGPSYYAAAMGSLPSNANRRHTPHRVTAWLQDHGPLWIVIGYLLLGGLWIIGSDTLIALFTDNAALLHLWQTYKGLFYVAVTGALLSLLLHRLHPIGSNQTPDRPGSVWVPYAIFFSLVLALLLIALLAFSGLRTMVLEDKHHNLEKFLGLKIDQVTAWREERRSELQTLATNSHFARAYARWIEQETANSAAENEARLADRLRMLVDSRHYHGAVVYDAEGRPRISVGEIRAEEEWNTDLAVESVETGDPTEAGPCRGEDEAGETGSRYAMAAPLIPIDSADKAVGALLLRLNPEESLYPLVAQWPRSANSGGAFLMRCDGDAVVFLSPPPGLTDDESKTMRMHRSEMERDGAFRLRDETRLFTARDHRGEKVLAAAAPVPGTDWHLVAQFDRDEALAVLDRFLWLELLLTVLLIAAAGGATRLWIARQHAFQNARYLHEEVSRRSAEQQVEYLTHHDRLTGLPNYKLLADRVNVAIARAQQEHDMVALLYVDLDRFKLVNESLGHEQGDELLHVAGHRLGECLRESDTLSRQGGDEFIILRPDVETPYEADRIAAKIHDQFSRPLEIDGHTLHVTTSIGIALYPEDGTDYGELLQNAETAMYAAKDAGREQHRRYDQELSQYPTRRLQMERDLRSALEQGHLELWYQPQSDLASGRIIGLEALIRWRHPTKGFIPPDHFIPMAEESGLIVSIGDWVIHEACRTAREWLDRNGTGLPIAVNLSAAQFSRSDLYETVEQALNASGLEGQYLELELTERLLIAETGSVLTTLHRLKHLEIMLSIDDFGTGYSSLAYLTRFPLDKLKVDRSFVSAVHRDPEQQAIVQAIVQMAHSLGLKAIAEGVEEKAEADFLRTLTCDELQGYWLSHPLPREELFSFLSRY